MAAVFCAPGFLKTSARTYAIAFSGVSGQLHMKHTRHIEVSRRLRRGNFNCVTYVARQATPIWKSKRAYCYYSGKSMSRDP